MVVLRILALFERSNALFYRGTPIEGLGVLASCPGAASMLKIYGMIVFFRSQIRYRCVEIETRFE